MVTVPLGTLRGNNLPFYGERGWCSFKVIKNSPREKDEIYQEISKSKWRLAWEHFMPKPSLLNFEKLNTGKIKSSLYYNNNNDMINALQ